MCLSLRVVIHFLLNGESGSNHGYEPVQSRLERGGAPKATSPPPTWSTRDSANALAAAFSTLKQRSNRDL